MSELKTDPLDQQCLACDEVMFRKGLLADKGQFGRGKGGDDVMLESDDADVYYVCPHCGSKNVVLSEQSPLGLPQLRISHIKQ